MAQVRAKSSFMVSPRRFVHAGDLLDEKDPVVKGREGLFEAAAAPKAPSAVSRAAVKKAAASSDG